ncbi:MAG: Flp pilus assembly protein CpaB [Acidimicrobiia bacterium]|nr:Flp pilus assembly protein CpaB [Acidimicrobiia bacterium]
MRPNAKRLGAATLALVLGAVGVVTLVRYVRTAEDRALAGQQLVDVVVATQPVEAGTRTDELALSTEVRRVPASTRTPGAITDLSEVGDMITSVDLVPGEQLLAARFLDGETRLVAGGEVQVEPGLVEVTVQINPSRAVGGQVVPGERVAVVAYVGDIDLSDDTVDPASGVLLRQALVTNVQSAAPETLAGEENDRNRQTPGSDFLVTLAVDPTEAERVVFADEYGIVWLAREGDEPTPGSGDLVQIENLFDRELSDALTSILAAADEEIDGSDDGPDGADQEPTAENDVDPATEEEGQ